MTAEVNQIYFKRFTDMKECTHCRMGNSKGFQLIHRGNLWATAKHPTQKMRLGMFTKDSQWSSRDQTNHKHQEGQEHNDGAHALVDLHAFLFSANNYEMEEQKVVVA